MGDTPIFDLGPIEGVANHGDTGLDIGTTAGGDAGGRHRLQQARRRSQKRNDTRDGRRLAVGAALIAVLLAVLVISLWRSGDEPRAADTPFSAADPFSTGDTVPPATTGPSQSLAPPPVPAAPENVVSFEPPSTEHLRADEIASLFERELNTEGNRYGIAYVANDEFVVLDHRGITLPALEIAVEFETVANLALLTNDGRTWAVNPVNREQNYLVSNNYVVVVSERPGTIAIIRPDDPSVISLMSSALPVPSLNLPTEAGLLWAQGRGPLVMPRTGGTFELSGIASSLSRISDARAVAASLHGTVYESCDDTLTCIYASQIGDGPTSALPFGSDTEFAISPDGRLVAAWTADSLSVFDVVEQNLVLTLDEEVTAIDWAPDSSFVAIVTGDALTVAYPGVAERPPVRLRLNQQPDPGSLLVFQG